MARQQPKRRAKGKACGKGKGSNVGKGKPRGKGRGKQRKGVGKEKGKGKGRGKPRGQQGGGQCSLDDADEAWRLLASHEVAVQRQDATNTLVLWVPASTHEIIENAAADWEAFANRGHMRGCGRADARFEAYMTQVKMDIMDKSFESDDSLHPAALKFKTLEGSEAYAPGICSEDDYVNTMSQAPSTGLVVDFAIMKSKYRKSFECPYRVTFCNDPWSSFARGFLLNLVITKTGEEKGWGIQRWRKG